MTDERDERDDSEKSWDERLNDFAARTSGGEGDAAEMPSSCDHSGSAGDDILTAAEWVETQDPDPEGVIERWYDSLPGDVLTWRTSSRSWAVMLLAWVEKKRTHAASPMLDPAGDLGGSMEATKELPIQVCSVWRQGGSGPVVEIQTGLARIYLEPALAEQVAQALYLGASEARAPGQGHTLIDKIPFEYAAGKLEPVEPAPTEMMRSEKEQDFDAIARLVGRGYMIRSAPRRGMRTSEISTVSEVYPEIIVVTRSGLGRVNGQEFVNIEKAAAAFLAEGDDGSA